jgi:hypothetical protein
MSLVNRDLGLGKALYISLGFANPQEHVATVTVNGVAATVADQKQTFRFDLGDLKPPLSDELNLRIEVQK